MDGIIYQINEHYDPDGNKVVAVTDSTEVNTIVNDGILLHITTETILTGVTKHHSIELADSKQMAAPQRLSELKNSLWWNYSYSYNDNYYLTNGMSFNLNSGNTYGVWAGFDNGNIPARNLAYDFCTDVRNLDTALWVASAASGAVAGSIAAAIAAAFPTAGVGTVVGIVSAIISSTTAIAAWVTAFNYSLNCNQRFLQFTQTV